MKFSSTVGRGNVRRYREAIQAQLVAGQSGAHAAQVQLQVLGTRKRLADIAPAFAMERGEMLHRLGEPPSVLPDEKARGVCGRELRALAAQLRAAVGAHPGEKGVPVVRKTQIGDALAGLQRAPQLAVPGRSRG